MALYGREVFGMVSSEVRDLLLFSTVFAVVGSAASGFATDRVGPKRTLLAVFSLWPAAISLPAAAPPPWALLLPWAPLGISPRGHSAVDLVTSVAPSPPA